MVREKSAGVLMKRLAMVSLLFSCVHVFLYAQSAPVVSDIPDQTVQEDAPFLAINLNAYVSDSDTELALLTWSYSGNTDLNVTIDAFHVATITYPANWNGSEVLTFTASDGLLSASDDVTFTVNAVNDAPLVSDIPNQTVQEDELFSSIDLNTYVSDVDDEVSNLTWSYSGNVNFQVSIDEFHVATLTYPTNWNGSEVLTFTASDGLLSASDDVTFTVNAVNDAPVVSDIPNQTVQEDELFSSIDLNTYVRDVDNEVSNLIWSYSGNVNFQVSIDEFHVATLTYPANWNGSEVLTFIASDGLLSASDDVTFTVNAVNDAPVVSDIPNQAVQEDELFSSIDLNTYVSDVDNEVSGLTWSFSGNVNLQVSIDEFHVATLTYPANWNGSEVLTFTASDGLLSASDVVTFTVNAVNDAPVVSDIPNQAVQEDELFSSIDLNTYVSDVDNEVSNLTWSYSGNVNFQVRIDEFHVATLTYPTNWNGSEVLTFIASDGLISASDVVTFTVNAVNDAPVVSDIPNQTVQEDELFSSIDLNTYVSDVDNEVSNLIWSYSGNVNLQVSIDEFHVATLTYPTNWNGSEVLTFTASDGLISASDVVTFTVNAVNDAPVVSDIPNQTVQEDELFSTLDLNTYVSDIDNEVSNLTWSYSGNVNLQVSIDEFHVATLTYPTNWNGSEVLTFTASDGLISASDVVTFTVNAVNDAPVVSDIPNQTVQEDELFSSIDLNTYVSDVDNEVSNLTWSYSGNVNFQVSIDEFHVATLTYPTNWNGSEVLTFTASDGLLSASDDVTFTVNAVNDVPVVSDIPNQTVQEDELFSTLDLNTYVSDVDNEVSGLTWSYSGNVNFQVRIDEFHVATLTYPANWNGSEVLTFIASDGLLSASDDVTFTVNAVNDAPVVSDIPNQAVQEDELFSSIDLNTYVSDVDNEVSNLIWSFSGNVNLQVSIDEFHVATLTYPTNWNGSEVLTFTASDGLLSASDDVTFTVNAVNDAPVVSDIPNQAVQEDELFSSIDLNTYVSDVDNEVSNLTWSYSGNVNFQVSIDEFHVATLTYPANWNGSEVLSFTASDGLLSASDDVTFTVNAVNDEPVVSDIPNQTVQEDELFSSIDLNTYVSDVDNEVSNLIWSYSGNVNFQVSIDEFHVATLTYPTNWNGSEVLTFTASDGLLSASDDVTFTVNAVNDAPVVSDIPNQAVQEDELFSTLDLNTYVSDVDNEVSNLIWSYSGNVNLQVTIDEFHVATLTYPTNWNGSEVLTFIASDGLISASDVVTFTVNAVNDAPVVSDIPNQTVQEDEVFSSIDLNTYVSDVDNEVSNLIWSYSGNVNLQVSIDEFHVATLTYPANWNGNEVLTFTASDGLLSASDDITFTVNAVNDAPVVNNIPNQTILEDQSFSEFDLDDFVTDVDNNRESLHWTFTGYTQLNVVLDDISHLVRISYPANWNGSETLTFTASDGFLSGSDEVVFTVSAENDPPVVSDIPDQIVLEDQLFTSIDLNNYVTDVDTDHSILSWSITFNEYLDISIDRYTNVANIAYAANWNGVDSVVFTVSDGMYQASDEVVFTVMPQNDPPENITLSNNRFDENNPEISLIGQFQTLDPDLNDQHSYSILSLQADNPSPLFSIDEDGFLYTARSFNYEQGEQYEIRVQSSDSEGLSISRSFTILINDINDRPVGVADEFQILEDHLLDGANILVNDFDEDGDELFIRIARFPEHGQLSLSQDGSIDYLPFTNYYGRDDFSYVLRDGDLESESIEVLLTVLPLNDKPKAENDFLSTSENTAKNIDILSNDSDDNDPEGGINPLSTEIVLPPKNGVAILLSGDHSLTYTPYVGFSGVDSIVYRIVDFGYPTPVLADTAKVYIEVTRLSPVALDDEVSTEEDVSVDVNVISNDDFVAPFASGSIRITQHPERGDLLIENDIIRYTPNENFNGEDAFTYQVSDLTGFSSNHAKVLIQIIPIPDAPEARSVSLSTPENREVSFNVRDYVSDPEGDEDFSTLAIQRQPNNGTVEINNETGMITYYPHADFSGTDEFMYNLSDEAELESNWGLVTVNVSNETPIANDDMYFLDEDQPVVMRILQNDEDYQNNILPSSLSILSQVTHGQLTINDQTGEILYQPSSNYYGKDVFMYQVCDETQYCSQATVSITINAVNDAPVAVNDWVYGIEDNALRISVLDNDFDIDSADEEFILRIIQHPKFGVIRGETNGVLDYEPNSNYSGNDTIMYQIQDQDGGYGQASVYIFISPENDLPIAVDDTFSVAEDDSLILNVFANDSDPDNDLDLCSLSIVQEAQYGDVISDSNCGMLRYIPHVNYNGLDSFTYSVCDEQGACDQAKVSIEIRNVADAPILIDDSFIINEDEASVLNVLGNDFDYDHDIDFFTLSIATLPINGIAEIDNYRIVYHPHADVFGSDSFTYSVCDETQLCSTAKVEITIQAVNDGPQTVADTIQIQMNQTVSIDVLENDMDKDENWNYSSLSIVNQAKNGRALTLDQDGFINYQPVMDYYGTDYFEYQICDLEGDCSTASVFVTIANVNEKPVTSPDSVTVTEDSFVEFFPLNNDFDPNNNLDPTTLEIIEKPQKGMAVVRADYSLLYKPYSNRTGKDYLVYQIWDDGIPALSSIDTVFVYIKAVNDSPIAQDDVVEVTAGDLVEFDALANDEDVEGDELSIQLIEIDLNYIDFIVASIDNQILIQASDGASCETYEFLYAACDSYGACDSASILLYVSPLDSDGDLVPDYIEKDVNGIAIDTDGDGVEDYLDEDSDNDNIPDVIEGGILNLCEDIPIDTDKDGIPDYKDQNSDNDLLSDREEGDADCDLDGIPNFLDTYDDCFDYNEVPEVFTPNGDGINDYFIIPGIDTEELKQNILVVYNRWGGEIYNKTNYDNSWDGRSSVTSLGSDKLPEGTYFYVFKAQNGTDVKGTVYIKY